MSPRKRIRTNRSQGGTPSSSSSAPSNEPTPLPTQTSTASRTSDASADSVMARSPAGSVAPSVAESTSNASRYASLRESKTKTRSWYGSWPRVPKSAASTQVAKETILGGTSKPSTVPDFSRFDTRKPSDAAADDSGDTSTLHQTAGLIAGTAQGEQPLSWQATEQPLSHDAKSGQMQLQQPPAELPGAQATAVTANATNLSSLTNPEHAADTANTASNTATEETEAANGPESMDTTQDTAAAPTAPAPASAGWFSWLGKKEPVATKAPAPEVAVPAPSESAKNEEADPPRAVEGDAAPAASAPPAAERPATSGSMWTYFWSGTPRGPPATAQGGEEGTKKEGDDKSAAAGAPQATGSEDVVMEDAPSAPIPVPAAASSASSTRGAANASAPATASAGSTWAFWSRDARKSTGKSPESVEQGEIAVIGDRSEANPKPAAGVKVNEPSSKASSMKDVPIKDAASKDAKGAASRKSKRIRPQSMDIDDIAPRSPATPQPETQTPAKGREPSAVAKQGTPAKAGQAATPARTGTPIRTPPPPPPNLLLPSFRSTYRLKENPSILRQIAQLLLRTQQAPASHVFLAKDPPKIKKAVAIGVHGLFPAAYLRPMIGQPTGTSIRFANHAADAVRRWADGHGCADCEIEKIALEGEGRIAERVENLWRLLLNWIDHIRSADLVVLACHSQGVPVGFMLLAKLIDMGILTTARVGVCAMAGVSLGPFPDYKSGLGMLMGSASELWDFGNPESEVSKRYEHALRAALDYGVRVAFVGSIDDQVVPLESAIYSPVHHPYVYRAVFVDGRIHAPDFIAHLVGFACKLRNLGVSDHGLIRELSVPLAGSLYSGEGHSRLYDDSHVYDLAISHALETADVGKAVCEITKHEGLANPNPYHLPWIMRGLLEEDFVKTELHDETAQLVQQFDDWKPVTKALKDVKYRLEAVRSKL